MVQAFLINESTGNISSITGLMLISHSSDCDIKIIDPEAITLRIYHRSCNFYVLLTCTQHEIENRITIDGASVSIHPQDLAVDYLISVVSATMA